MESTLAQGLRLFLLLFFVLALCQKLARPLRFEDVLRAYALLPEALILPGLWAIMLAEGLAAALLATPWWRTGLTLSAILLAIYAAAMAVNLLRGRIHHCGCGELDEHRPLQPLYPLRNLALAGMALQLAQTTGPVAGVSWVLTTLVALALLIAWQIAGQYAEGRD